jgi:hypothetical protein
MIAITDTLSIQEREIAAIKARPRVAADPVFAEHVEAIEAAYRAADSTPAQEPRMRAHDGTMALDSPIN